MNIPAFLIISLIIGYCFGSIPFALVIPAITRRKNILKLGNKRPGAANVFREIGPVTGIVCGLFDALKASGAMVLTISVLGYPEYALLTCAFGAILGHNWPFTLKFSGGEGVSVTMGVYIVFAPGILGLMMVMYLCFLGLWALKIRPFYRYHGYNWQTVFLLTPLLVHMWGDSMVLSVWNISSYTFLLLSVTLGCASLLKQIQLYGVTFLFKPSHFKNKYVSQ